MHFLPRTKRSFIVSLFWVFLITLWTARGSASIDTPTSWIAISDLKPSQYSIGKWEVERKIKRLSKLSPKEFSQYLHNNPVPLIKGPRSSYYIVDHHHLTRALFEMGATHIKSYIMADLSHLKSADLFWMEMKKNKWVYLKDNKGRLIDVTKLPRHISELKNDPYRSLAGQVREKGGYEKVNIPFTEFIWADFFRERIQLTKDKSDYKKKLSIALVLAFSDEAKALPGALTTRSCKAVFSF